jgi:ribonuclease HI
VEHNSPLSSSRSTQVTIYTDGGAIGNPGPGGYGIVLLYGKHRKELHGGFRFTTNNRMELTAAIVALQTLKWPCTVTLYTDSRYLVDGIEKGWVRKWQANMWKRKNDPVPNADLWQQLLPLLDTHAVTLKWVRGHAGNPNNERCDMLVQEAVRQPHLPADTVYEATAEGVQ